MSLKKLIFVSLIIYYELKIDKKSKYENVASITQIYFMFFVKD